MPKKKAAISGFTILMKELQEKYARQGQKVPPLKDMKDIADPIWKSMSVQEKFEYNQRAKACKNEIRQTTHKLASDGTSIQENFEKELEKETLVKQRIADIQSFIGAFQDPESFRASAVGQYIYVMGFNIVCVTDDEECIPLEIGIAEYCVQKGITRTYHKFIHPGKLPFGCAGDAKFHSEDTHKIPFAGHPDSEKNHKRLWEEIRQFLCPNGSFDDLPPVFCLNDSIDQTAGCLRWILGRAGAPVYLFDEHVWDLGQLLHEMRSAIGQMIVSSSIATGMLQKNTFDFEPNTRCDFHEDLDSAYCALGYVKRLCFLLSDCLCVVFGITPTERHLPLRTSENKGYEIFIPAHNESKEFLESEVPRRMASRASERYSMMSSRASQYSQISSRMSETSQSCGLDTFTDDDDDSYYSFASEVTKNHQTTDVLPVSQMANLKLSTGSAATSHTKDSVISPSLDSQVSSSGRSSVALDTFDEEESSNESLRKPRKSASAFSHLQFKTGTPALGRGIGRGRLPNP